MKTLFSLNNYPSNLIWPMEWSKFANRAFSKPVSIKTAMKRFAETKGGAMFAHPDGRLIVLTKLESGKLRQTTYNSEEWGWA